MIAPVVEPIEAIDVLVLLHMPPGVVLVSVLVTPVQMVFAPEIATGIAFTVTTLVDTHPDDGV